MTPTCRWHVNDQQRPLFFQRWVTYLPGTKKVFLSIAIEKVIHRVITYIPNLKVVRLMKSSISSMNHRSYVCLKCFHVVRFGDKIIYFQISGNENYSCSDIFLLKRYAYYKLNMDFILSIEIIHICRKF